MEGKLLAEGIASLRGTDLRMVYALLTKVGMSDLVSSKVKGLFQKKTENHFAEHLEKEVRKLRHLSDTVIQMNLFLELTKVLKLRGTRYDLQRELDDQCMKIVESTYDDFQKADTQFKEYAERSNNTSKLEIMVYYQLEKMIEGIDFSRTIHSKDEEDAIVDKVEQFIGKLPEEQQRIIKDKLGIDELTNELLRKSIRTSGVGVLIGVLVEVGGFAFYTGATTLVASIAGIVGLTLPFGVYTGMTSFIAVIVNPFFLIPFLTISTGALLFKQNDSFKKKLLPVILMQIVLPRMISEDTKEVSVKPFIDEWKKRYDTCIELIDQDQKLEEEMARLTRAKADYETQKEILRQENRMSHVEIEIVKSDIKKAIQKEDLTNIYVSTRFTELRKQYEIALSQEKSSANQDSNSRPSSNSSFVSSATYLEQMLDEVFRSDSDFGREDRKFIHLEEEDVEQRGNQIQEYVRKMEDSRVALSNLQIRKIRIRQSIDETVQQNHGMKDILPKFI